MEYKDRDTTLVPLPKILSTGDICRQGLPNYLGDVTLTLDLGNGKKPKAILLPDCKAGATKVTLNGTELGVRLWGPYVFNAAKAPWNTKKSNVLEITLSTNLGLLLKRRYGCARYADEPVGLLSKPRFF